MSRGIESIEEVIENPKLDAELYDNFIHIKEIVNKFMQFLKSNNNT